VNIYTALGLEQSGGGLFIFFLLYSSLFMVVVEPLISTFSRSHEFGADEFGANKTNKEYMISALKKLGKENKSFPLSHPFYSFVYHSHPTLFERLKHLENL
jgi:STE24 endopeptidase